MALPWVFLRPSSAQHFLSILQSKHKEIIRRSSEIMLLQSYRNKMSSEEGGNGWQILNQPINTLAGRPGQRTAPPPRRQSGQKTAPLKSSITLCTMSYTMNGKAASSSHSDKGWGIRTNEAHRFCGGPTPEPTHWASKTKEPQEGILRSPRTLNLSHDLAQACIYQNLAKSVSHCSWNVKNVLRQQGYLRVPQGGHHSEPLHMGNSSEPH